jgi:uncharacterized repeat protein (TIGR01451 family)
MHQPKETAMCTSLILTLLSGTAFAASGPDLSTSITAPASIQVDSPASYSVKVSNIGNRDASNVSLSIQLPATHTSPSVYVMGDLSSYSGSCVRSGTRLNCSLGTIRKAKSSTVSFTIALPQSSAPIAFSATASISNDVNTGNNSASSTASITYEEIDVDALVGVGPLTVSNNHCTGTGLTAWFECTLFPSSISFHEVEFEAGGTLTIPQEPGYYGYWGQDSLDQLWFEYWYAGAMVASFEGNGVSSGCFEGLTMFYPDNGYVSPYEVCF